MVRFAGYVSHILDNNDNPLVFNTLKTVESKYLNNAEKELYNVLYNHIENYGKAPTFQELISSHPQFNAYYTSGFATSDTNALLDSLYETMRENLKNYVASELSDGNMTIDKATEILSNLPTRTRFEVKRLSSLITDKKEHLIGIDESSKYKLGIGEYGLLDGKLCILAAPTNTGKTTLSLFYAVKRFMSGYNVAIFSFEEDELSFLEKAVGVFGSINTKVFEETELGSSESDSLKEKINQVSKTIMSIEEKFGNYLHIEYLPSSTPIQKLKKIINDHSEAGIDYDLIIVDAIYKIGHDSLEGWQANESIIGMLNDICVGLPCKMLCTTQLDIDSNGKSAKLPKSRSYPETAHTVITIVPNELDQTSLIATIVKSRGKHKLTTTVIVPDYENGIYRVRIQGDEVSLLDPNDIIAYKKPVEQKALYPNNDTTYFYSLSHEDKKVWNELAQQCFRQELSLDDANKQFSKHMATK